MYGIRYFLQGEASARNRRSFYISNRYNKISLLQYLFQPIETSCLFEYEVRYPSSINWNRSYSSSSIFFFSFSPAFIFSRFPGVEEQDNMVSFTTFMRLSRGTISSMDEIPLKHFLVKVTSDATDSDIDEIIKLFNNEIISKPWLSVWDYREEVSSILIAFQISSFPSFWLLFVR